MNGYTDTPSDSDVINTALSYGNTILIKNLHGDMTYSEIVSSVGSEVVVDEPTKYYNEIDGAWEYSLSFNYDEYGINVTWDADPTTTPAAYMWAAKIGFTADSVDLPESTTQTQSGNAANENSSTDVALLMDKALAHLKEEYPNVAGLEFYSDYDGMISCYIKDKYETDYNPAYFGLEIYKSTKEVKVYNFSGRIVYEFILQ